MTMSSLRPSWGQELHGIEAGPYDALMANDARVTGDDQRADDPNEAAARELVQLLQATWHHHRGRIGHRHRARRH